jgi:hypothetical protein
MLNLKKIAEVQKYVVSQYGEGGLISCNPNSGVHLRWNVFLEHFEHEEISVSYRPQHSDYPYALAGSRYGVTFFCLVSAEQATEVPWLMLYEPIYPPEL